jgi:hypothetical protein
MEQLFKERVVAMGVDVAAEPADAYLGDRTAFDAFIEYRADDSRLCALGIETKLTEPFSQKEYDGERYRRWMRVAGAPWRPDAEGEVQKIRHNQLWRDHLLAVAVGYHPRSPYDLTRLMVVHHPGDRERVDTLAGYRRLLRDGDHSLIPMPLDLLVDHWVSRADSDAHQDWLKKLKLRYLDLDSSA